MSADQTISVELLLKRYQSQWYSVADWLGDYSLASCCEMGCTVETSPNRVRVKCSCFIIRTAEDD
jgi:hypothetical protein